MPVCHVSGATIKLISQPLPRLLNLNLFRFSTISTGLGIATIRTPSLTSALTATGSISNGSVIIRRNAPDVRPTR